MSLTKTTLAAALTAQALDFVATSATGATVGGVAKIEDEYAVITAINSTTISVRSRGDNGTTAKAHNSGAALVFGLASDLPVPSPHINTVRDIRYYPATAGLAVELPTDRDMVAVINANVTVANPSAVASGLMLHIVSATAAGHTITLTTGYGGSNATDVFTMSGAIGDSVTLMSLNGTWSHVATGLVAADTVSATVA